MDYPGNLFVVAAPSGTGKSSLVKALMELDSRVQPSVSHTTRAPRGQEKHGREYFFTSEAEFEAMVQAGAFLEWALVHGHRYGTSRKAIEERIKDMDKMGVDIQAISPAPYHYFYFTEHDRGASLARDVNEGIASLVAAHPDRFVGLGSVPLQNPELAVQELEYAVKTLGLRGVEINTNVNGKNLTDPSLGLEKFFAKANELGTVIFLHPMGFTQGERLTNHYFNNVIGNPLDTTIAVSHLIFDGVVARNPKIKFIAAHGGGYIAHYWARMDHAWRARKDCRTVIKRAPSTYLEKFYFDSITFDPMMLKHLIDRFGAEHVLMGTDYPYDMGEDDPRGLIAAVKGLPAAQRKQIEGLNAMKLLKIKL